MVGSITDRTIFAGLQNSWSWLWVPRRINKVFELAKESWRWMPVKRSMIAFWLLDIPSLGKDWPKPFAKQPQKSWSGPRKNILIVIAVFFKGFKVVLNFGKSLRESICELSVWNLKNLGWQNIDFQCRFDNLILRLGLGWRQNYDRFWSKTMQKIGRFFRGISRNMKAFEMKGLKVIIKSHMTFTTVKNQLNLLKVPESPE